jgi:hypothetical protein
MGCEWFDLKTTRTVFTGLASKPVVPISSGLVSKPAVTVFSSLASKLVATVSPGLASKSAVGFLVEPQNQGGGGFPCLGLKISSSDLVIWASKSPRRFLDLGLKTKWASVCRLRHKTDGGRSARDTSRDLAACLAWKQVRLGFPSLPWRLAEARRRVVHVAPSRRLHRRQTEDRWVDATGCVGPCYPCFAVFFLLGHMGVSFSLLLGPIYRTLEGWGSLSLSNFILHF